MMKRLDAVLLGIVFVVWGVLALMYATIPMIQMPTSFRVWGLGALLFLVLAILAAYAVRRGRDH
jgi:membrane protein implicated in regulation of membrane protease activity